MTMALLSIRDLQTTLQTPSGPVVPVESVTLDVFPGETVGLVGESGSGKSMVARSILRIVPQPGDVSGGQVLFEGSDLAAYSGKQMESVRGGGIGMVFQDASTYLNPVMAVGQQIAEAVELHCPGYSVDAKVQELLSLVELPDPTAVARRFPHELSGGMRQRVMIAMALAGEPRLLIADEPTTALDVTIQAQILELLKSLKVRLGLSVLMISHDLGVIGEVCDRVYVMYAGRVCEMAPVAQFFQSPRHPYSAGLLRSALSLEVGTELYSIGGTVADLTNPPTGCRFHPRCSLSDGTTCVHQTPELSGRQTGILVACHHPLDDRSVDCSGDLA